MSAVFFYQGNVDWYLANTVLLLVVLVYAFINQRSKRGIMPGAVITRMTLSSDEKWKQVNRFSATLSYIIAIPLLVVNTIFYIVDKQKVYAFTVTIVISIAIIAYAIIVMVYTDILERRWLAEQKKKGHPVSDFEFAFPGIPKKRIITGTIILGVVVVALFILQFFLFK